MPASYAAWTDFREHRVPNLITGPVFIAGLIYALYTSSIGEALIGFGALFGIGLVIFLMGGMGGGDVKLLAGLGVWFGFADGLAVIFIASVAGIIWGIGKKMKADQFGAWVGDFLRSLHLRFILKAKGVMDSPRLPDDVTAPIPKEAIPFGTCLVFAAWLVYFVDIGRVL